MTRIKQRLVRKQRRPEIDQTTMAISMGPLSFDVTMARYLGWSERGIANTWETLSNLMKRRGPKARRTRRG